MEDIAKIGFKAESDELVTAKKRIEELEPAAKKAETASEKLEKKLKQLDGQTVPLANNTGKLLTILKNFAVGVAGAFGVQQYIKLADTWQDLQDRVGLAMGDINKGAEGLARVADMARTTYSPLVNTAELFTRNAKTLKELGYSTNQTFDFVEAFNNALVISGARGQRAESVMNAMSKAMAGGALRGEELNTIIESGGKITELLAAKLGVTTGELRKLGADGKITGDVIYNALVGSLDALRTEAESMTATFGDAMSLLGGKTLQLVGEFDQLTGASGLVASAIVFVADNLRQIAVYGASAALVLGATYVPAMYAAVTSTLALVAASITLRGALIATGIGALVVIIGWVVNKVIDLADELGGLAAVWLYVKNVGTQVWEAMAAGASWLGGALERAWINIKIRFAVQVQQMRKIWADFLTFVASNTPNVSVGPLAGVYDAVAGAAIGAEARISAEQVAIDRMGKDVERVTGEMAANWEKASTAINLSQAKIAAGTTASGGNATKDADLGGTVKTETLPPGLNLTDTGSGGGGGGAAEQKTALEELAEAYNNLAEPFNQAKSAYDAIQKAQENGLISNDAYVEGLARIQAAFMQTGGTAEQWARIMGDKTKSVGEQMKDLAKNSVERLGESFAELAVEGSANFGDLAKSIIKDLINIMIQALIVKPILEFFGLQEGGAVGGGGLLPFEKGGAFGAQPFAKGGSFTNDVVNRPTFFAFANGGALGVMGEAGPEAVMPLQRGPDGSLGVQMFGGRNKGAGGDSAARGAPLEIIVRAEEGDMFRPTVEVIADERSTAIMQVGMEEMNAQLPGRVEEISRDMRVR